MQIIPALDIMDGKCVRLRKGDYSQQTSYHVDPIEIAQEFVEIGATKLHLVDLDGAKAKQLINLKTIESICQTISIPVEVGGGIRTQEGIECLFSLGASEVIIGSLSVTNPEQVGSFLRQYGAEKIIVAIDLLNGEPRISGWLEAGGQTTDQLIQRLQSIGLKTLIVTDIDRDGTLSSPNFELYEGLIQKYPDLDIIASGGVSSITDLKRLPSLGVKGCILGKSLYEGTIKLTKLSAFIEQTPC